MQRKEDQFQVEQPAVETRAAATNSLRKKHMIINAKIAAPNDLSERNQRERKISFQTYEALNYGGDQVQMQKTNGKQAQKYKVQTNSNNITTTNTSSSTSLDMTPQRSKSETPANHAITNVLYQVHMKLQRPHRVLSPNKLLAKHQERQQRAEHLRMKIENGRKELRQKVKHRQQLARERQMVMVEKQRKVEQLKKLSLQDKLQQARLRQEAELQNVVEKAKAENMKAEETNFIIRLTKQNQQLDLDNKLTEAEGRRQQQIERDIEKLKGQELKREAADKRRRELSEETKTKFLTNEQKREQAEKRRCDQRMVEKNRANAERAKREKVKARKSHHGHKISDIMSFVNNSESLWEFIGMEQDWENMGVHLNLGYQKATEISFDASLQNVDEDGKQREKDLLSMIQKDQFELEKLMLKRDHEILNHCIHFDEDGSIKIMQSPYSLMQRGGHRSSSSDSIDSSDEKKIANRTDFVLTGQNSSGQPGNADGAEEKKFQSPIKDSPVEFSLSHRLKGKILNLGSLGKQKSQTLHTPRPRIISGDHDDRLMDGEKHSKPKDGQECETEEVKSLDVKSRQASEVAQSHHTQNTLTDEYFDQKLRQQGMKMSMRRNILRRTLSEDLTWAECIKDNPNYETFTMLRQMHHSNFPQGMETISVHSNSPERALDNSFEQMEEDSMRMIEMSDTQVQESNQDAKIDTPQKTSGKGAKHTDDKFSKTAGNTLNNSKRSKKNRKGSANKKMRLSMDNSNQSELTGINSKEPSGLSMLQPGKNKGTKKQLFTLSNQESCSSLEGKFPAENQEIVSLSQMGTLNQQQLDSLGPVVKMTINGFSFSQGGYDPGSQMQTMQSSIYENLQDESISISNASLFSSSTSTPSFQMNSLIMNQRPIPLKPHFSSVHHHNQSLSKNANLYLFPIREQKIILMYPDKEKEFDFAQAKITLKIEEVKMATTLQPGQILPILPQPTNSLIQTPQPTLSLKKPAEDLSQVKMSNSPGTPPKTKSTLIAPPSGIKAPPEESKRTPTKHVSDKEKELNNSSTPRSSKRGDSFKKPEGRLSIETSDSFKAAQQIDNVNESPKDELRELDRIINLIAKKLLIDQLQYIKIDESQKSILLDGTDESAKVLRFLEVNELGFKYCRLCEVAILRELTTETDAATAQNAINEHFQSKSHLRARENLNIKETEDHAFALLDFQSQPGDITQELKKEKEKALKRKVKKLKVQILNTAVSHENASTYPGKELKSSNKNRLQIRCIELEKSVFPAIKNYDTVEAILNDVIRVLEKRGAGDIHLMRKLKFIPNLIDICKRISICPKQSLKHLAKILNLVIKILIKFCISRENRNYMLQTNRLLPLIELFHWCLNRQTELFFGIEFVPSLFQLITSHLKHRVPYECQQMKELLVDYLISSQITVKLKNKHAIVKSIPSIEIEEIGQVPFFLLKSATFLEALTAMISTDARTRPVYEKSYKIGEHVFFVLQNTELFGITQMVTTLLLSSNETFKASAPQSNMTLILPQTMLSLAIMSIKVLNNILRMDCQMVQQLMTDQNEQLYHLLNFLLTYAETNIDKGTEDVKELLHETLILIGYFCLLNEDNQNITTRGENSILQKLCNLPFGYFFDKKKKEILFPTLIAATYQNQRALAIIDQEMDISVLFKFVEQNISEELPKIMEQEQEYFSDHTRSMGSEFRARSPSISSTGSMSVESVQMDFLTGNNPYLPLVMRFPKKLWKDAAAFYKSNEK